jgi:nucleoside-diphosphate-sugar epimerase
VRILITGSAGMLGSAVFPAFVDAGQDVVATDLKPREVRGLPMDLLDVHGRGRGRGRGPHKPGTHSSPCR